MEHHLASFVVASQRALLATALLTSITAPGWSALRPEEPMHFGYLDLGETEHSESHFGATLASGDFDGDGFEDLAIGAPRESNDRFGDAGAVYILPGGPDGFENERSYRVDQASVPCAAKPSLGSNFGFSLAAGDLDQDGIDDLAVGGPGINSEQGLNSGAVFLLWGSFKGLKGGFCVFQNQAPPLTPGAVLGHSLAIGSAPPLGSGVEGDDRPQILAGAPGWRVTGGPGGEGGILAISADGNARTLQCTRTRSGDRCGHALANFDTDGWRTLGLAVSTPGRDQVIDGKRVIEAGGVSLRFPYPIHDRQALEIKNWASDNKALGTALISGNFDCQSGEIGGDELAVGHPFAGPQGHHGAGRVEIYVIKNDGDWDSDIYGSIDQSQLNGAVEAGDHLGSALAAGDFDGDGCDDLVVGAEGEEWRGRPDDHGGLAIVFGDKWLTLDRFFWLRPDQIGLPNQPGLRLGGGGLTTVTIREPRAAGPSLVIGLPRYRLDDGRSVGLVVVVPNRIEAP